MYNGYVEPFPHLVALNASIFFFCFFARTYICAAFLQGAASTRVTCMFPRIPFHQAIKLKTAITSENSSKTDAYNALPFAPPSSAQDLSKAKYIYRLGGLKWPLVLYQIAPRSQLVYRDPGALRLTTPISTNL